MITHRKVVPPEVLTLYLTLQKWKSPCVKGIASSARVFIEFRVTYVERKSLEEAEGPSCQLGGGRHGARTQPTKKEKQMKGRGELMGQCRTC